MNPSGRKGIESKREREREKEDLRSDVYIKGFT